MRLRARKGLFLLTVIPLSMLPLIASGPAANADPVDDYVRAEMQNRHITGLSLAVVLDGRVIKAQGYGFANLERRVPATPETVYQLASLTKPLTATAVMLLVQDGQLDLGETIGKYLQGVPDTWQHITVQHLLTHTSGIKDYLREVLDERTRIPGPDMTPEEIVHRVAALPLNFAPGEQYAYSNTNYVMLGLLIHRVSGKRYDQLLAERVFMPLAMTSTGLDGSADVVANGAAGYEWTGNGWQDSPRLNPATWNNGDGGLRSTVLDLARWDAALYGDALLSGRSKQEMWRPVTLTDGSTHGSGLGWWVDTVLGHPRITSNGGRSGTSTTLSRFLDDRLTVIVLTNQSGVDTEKIAFYVAGFYVPSLARPIYYPIPDTDPQNRARIGTLMDGFAQGKRDTELLPPGIEVSLSGFSDSPDGEGISDTLYSLGAVRSIRLVERKTEGDRWHLRYRVEYPMASLLVGYTLSQDDTILSLSLERE